MTAQNDTDYAAVKLQPYRLLTLRTEFEAAAASAPAEFSVDGLRYTRAERNGLLYYIQRGVKFPCDALFRDGRLIAWLCPCREQANLLVRDGFEEYTPLALWKDYAARPLYGVSMLGTFHMPMRDGVELAADVYLPEGAPLPVPALLVRTPYDKMTAHRPISVMCAAAMPWWCRMYADAMRAAANGCPIITRWRTETIRSLGLERRNGATEASACWVVHTSDIHSGARRLWATRI